MNKETKGLKKEAGYLYYTASRWPNETWINITKTNSSLTVPQSMENILQ